MIKCNSHFEVDAICVACMDAQQSLGGTIVCDTAEELDYNEENILKICEFAEKDQQMKLKKNSGLTNADIENEQQIKLDFR